MNIVAKPTTTPDTLATLCKALGDAMRVEVLRVLRANSYGVLELAEVFEVTQPRISHHLKVLATAGLVSTRREGNSIFYRRPQLAAQDPLASFKQNVFSQIDLCAVSQELQERLEQVHLARAAVSSQFFVENAQKFRAQQDLIASFPVYAQAIEDLLDNTPLPAHSQALELGPGEGEFLPVLSQRFESVLALDNSASMLDKAGQLKEAQGLANVTLRLGDTSTLTGEDSRFDCVVCNMVLHHTPSPVTIFQQLQPALKTGGALLITELCLHDQPWVKEACGDVWLGFDPNDIDQWAVDAGFSPGQSLFFALRNGFQIQLKQFFKP